VSGGRVRDSGEPSATVARAPTSAQRRIRCTSGKDSKGYAVAAGKGRKLVIVESPAKAKKIAEYLGGDFEVEASVGHIRDLPNPRDLPADLKKGPFGKFAVDVDNGFEPYYVVDADKRKKVADLKRLVKDSSELYLATDEDREGEAIAWHLLEALQPRIPVKRMVFHEITREAIQRAVTDTRELDTSLVDAQETRRILDRLYGYEVSPVLWRKVRQGLSAGRVQSVATRMVVERERERMAFVAASYWDVEAEVTPRASKEPFTARLTGVDGRRVASGRDFGDDGRLKGSAVHLDQSAARAIAQRLRSAEVTVTDVAEKPYTRRPAAPFTTSTLQQEASRKLRMSSKTRDAGRPAALRERLHHLYADRLGHPLGGGRVGGSAAGSGSLRRRLRARDPAGLHGQGEERPRGA
jgi:DNA topoisomerase-1